MYLTEYKRRRDSKSSQKEIYMIAQNNNFVKIGVGFYWLLLLYMIYWYYTAIL